MKIKQSSELETGLNKKQYNLKKLMKVKISLQR